MLYKDFKGLSLSRLGFGAMRLPCVEGEDATPDQAAVDEMVDYALEHGVNYFDMAAADAAPVYVAECSAWAGSDVQSAYALGIADSYAACLAAPQASATRAELAHMLSDLLQRV